MAKHLGEREFRSYRAGGLKKALGRLLSARAVNRPARSLARHLGPGARLRLPLAQPSVEYRQTTAAVRLLEPRIDQVARDVFWGGGKPQSAADARTLRCVEALCRDGGTFLDIGSYSGLFAMAAARAHREVRAVAYEIVPENFLLIWRNVIGNDLVHQVEPRLLAVGESTGSITMPSELHLPSLASSVSIGSEFESGIAVPVATLDALCAGVTGPLVMKIDVEGFEGAVFRGGRSTLERLRPDIICEFLPDSEDHEEIGAMLAPLGYRFFQSRKQGFQESEAIVPDDHGRDWLLSCRPDVEAIIARL